MAERCVKQTFHITISKFELVSNCHSLPRYHQGNVSYVKGSFFTHQMMCTDIIVSGEWIILTAFPFFVALFSLLLLNFSYSACIFSFTCYIYHYSKPVMTMNFIVRLCQTNYN